MHISRAGRAGVLAILGTLLAIVAFIGTAGMSYAEPLGSDIVCHVYTTLNELGSPIPALDASNCPNPPPVPPPSPEPTPPPASACEDGIDNDGDSFIDLADPGCSDASDNDETDPVISPPPATPAQCADGTDNDGDSKIDADDPGCVDGADNDETDPVDGEPSPSPAPSLTPTPTPTPSPSPSATPSSSGGGGGSPSAGSGSSSGGGASASLPPGTALYTSTSTGSGAPAPQVLGMTSFSTTTESCDRYLTAFIREGNENDVDQVKRLQRFLRDFEGAEVAETGIYDSPTLSAVHAFQTKYAADILTPWGIKESTGYVYLTTRKKVNEIFCGYTKVFYLTVDEQKKIDDSRVTSAPTPGVVQNVLPTKNAAKLTNTDASATTTAKGQGVIDRSLQFLRGFWDRAR